MKAPNLAAVSLLLIVAFTLTSFAQDNTSVDVQTSCAHWAKLRVDKHKQFKGDSNDLYQTGVCMGYFEGLMDGMDKTGAGNSKMERWVRFKSVDRR